ncbi:MAG: tail fiber protein [Caudoviricetes sp.]|nr:MAG: tail fiber protein [Caudoviricetes sp.]
MTIPIKSSTPVIGVLLSPDNLPKRPTIDYELGGVGLQNPSQGLMYQEWRCWFDRDKSAVMVESPNTPPTKIFDQERIVWLSFCFDQNMRWSSVYTLADGLSYLRWYNSLIGGYDITELASGVVTPFLSLDDKRPLQSGVSDIILAYIQNQSVILRVQRERFQVPHVWAEDIPNDWTIRNFGMSNKLRLQMEIR